MEFVLAGAIYMEIRGQRKKQEVALAKAASGPSHASVTPRLLVHLCLCLCLCPCLFLAFGSATLVVLRFCNSHTPLLSFSLQELLFHFSSIKLGSSQHRLCLKGNDDDRAYDNQGGIEGTGHTRYMGPPLTPGPHWSALRNTTASCASNCNRLL